MSDDADGGSIPTGSQPPIPEPRTPEPLSETGDQTYPPPADAELPAAQTESPVHGPTGDQPGDQPEELRDEEPKKPGSFLKELPILILIAFGLALLIKTFLIQAFYIPSESMVPTLNVGDRVLVNKVVYKIRQPRRGEIVVFAGRRVGEERSFWQRVRDALTSGFGGRQGPETDFIKRIIGLPGETVEGVGGRVVITPAGGGETITLDEPYVAPPGTTSPFTPVTVPAGHYFVMGDNRNNSADSRGALGPIPKGEIVGRAFVRVWPIGRFHRLTRPDYPQAAVLILPLVLWEIRRRRGAA